ncbi:hypothetical protein OROHE_011502 [Orobanche hederae]
MASSSSSRTRETRNSRVNGEIIKFRNELCKCNKRASVRISESTSNPQKLYFKCEHESCNFFKFREPKHGDVNWSSFVDTTCAEIGQYAVLMEVKSLEGGVEVAMRSLQFRMQGLNSSLGGIKLIMVLCFVMSLVTLLGLVFISLK